MGTALGVNLHGSLNDLFSAIRGGNENYAWSNGRVRGSVIVPNACGGPDRVPRPQGPATAVRKRRLHPLRRPDAGAAEPSGQCEKRPSLLARPVSLVIYSGGAFAIGELRVGTTYADATPLLYHLAMPTVTAR